MVLHVSTSDRASKNHIAPQRISKDMNDETSHARLASRSGARRLQGPLHLRLRRQCGQLQRHGHVLHVPRDVGVLEAHAIREPREGHETHLSSSIRRLRHEIQAKSGVESKGTARHMGQGNG